MTTLAGAARPVVSVCITTHNHEAFISECLQSVLAQRTSFPVEIVLGEDNSEDLTPAICQRFARRYPGQIRLFVPDPRQRVYIGGLATGLHNHFRAIGMSQGSYVALLNGDDYWTDDRKLEKQVEALRAEPSLAGCFHATKVIYEDGSKPPHAFRDPGGDRLGPSQAVSLWSPLHLSSFLFCRRVLPLPLWLGSVLSFDMGLFAHVALHGDLQHLDFVGSVYRRTTSGVTGNANYQGARLHEHRIDLWSKFLQATADIANDERAIEAREQARAVIEEHRDRLALAAAPDWKQRLRGRLRAATGRLSGR